MEKDILNVEQAAAFLKTSKPTFYRWLHDGKLKGFKAGREWRFYRSDLLSFLESSDREKEELKKELRQANEMYARRVKKKGINVENLPDL